MIDCGEVPDYHPEHFVDGMSLPTHEGTSIDGIVKQPGLIAIGLLLELQQQLNITSGM